MASRGRQPKGTGLSPGFFGRGVRVKFGVFFIGDNLCHRR